MSDITRKLALLEYPRLAAFKATDFNEIVMLVAFLEDRCVRLLDVDKRAPLRKAGEAWHAAFSSYLVEAGCPYVSDAHPYSKDLLVDYVRWLVGSAISLSYEDSAPAINSRAAAAIAAAKGSSSDGGVSSAVAGSSPVTDVGGSAPSAAPSSSPVSPEAAALIAELASMLHVSADERDSLHTLQAAHRAIRQRLLPAIASVDAAAAGGAGAGAAARPKGGSLAGRIRKPVALPPAAAAGGAGAGASSSGAAGSASAGAGAAAPPDVSVFPAGLSTGDELLDKATAVLRMLYVADLRELQDAVTDIVVTVQEFTANPKTDASLGAVGR